MESKNILIRESIFEDCQHFYKWETMPEVTEFFTINEGQSYEDVATKFIKCKMDPSKMLFTILKKEDMQPIGQIYLTKINQEEDATDITRIYIADKNNRGKGLGEEALSTLLDYLFLNMHMERVTLDHFTGNNPAAQLYLKTGFQYEGVMRNAAKKDGKYYDLHLMSLLRAEYYEKKV